MKKSSIACLASLAFAACLAGGCGDGDRTITVGASSTPHAEILNAVKDELAADGWTLNVVVYGDYVLPNLALENGELDANYFQHTPYLDNFNLEKGTHLVSAAKIHYEPFGVYGKNVTREEFGAVKTGRTIFVPGDGTNCTRALLLLQEEGYVKLRDGVKASDALTDKDVLDPNGNEIVLVAAEQVPAQLRNSDDGTLAVVNGNFALASGLNVRDALATERADGDAAQLYANIVAVRSGTEHSEKTQALVRALQSKTVSDFIERTYGGAVLPVFTP